MEIDNSRANAFRVCPYFYYEAYDRNGKGVEPLGKGEEYSPIELGTRGHELMEMHYGKKKVYPPHQNEKLEAEAQWIMDAYKARYFADDWDILDTERTIRVELPRFCKICYHPLVQKFNNGNGGWLCENQENDECGTLLPYNTPAHIYIGKMDLFIHDRSDDKLYIIDHKFEKRGAKSNLPQKWNARDQASLYLWAARKVYNESISNFIVNISTRPSPAGREGPSFDRQKLERTEHQMAMSIRDIVYVADRIEECQRAFGDGEWPSNREECYKFSWYCDYYHLHRYAEGNEQIDLDLILKHKYQQRGEYLFLDGVKVIK